MEIIRTFHPVGQGAFYSERFCEDGGRTVFTVVYDCGTETSATIMDVSLDKQIEQFCSSLGPAPQIDILFISHFHADHINGLERLLKKAKVEKTVIPMIDPAMICVTQIQNHLRYGRGVAFNSDKIIDELYFHETNSTRFGEIVYVEPMEEGKEYNTIDFSNILHRKGIPSGKILPNGVIWEYVPINSIENDDPRIKELYDGLVNMGLKKCGLGELIKNQMYEVKQLYRSIMKNTNDNLYSLVVVSRPVDGIIPYPCPRLSHCIYFGDFDFNQSGDPWRRLKKIIDYSKIGTVQVPHHGAKRNWCREMGKGDPRHYIVSAGSTNRYHHPNYWVLQDIWEEGHRSFVVSERSMYERTYSFEIK